MTRRGRRPYRKEERNELSVSKESRDGSKMEEGPKGWKECEVGGVRVETLKSIPDEGTHG